MEQVFVVSDGTGRTAEQALNAAMTQFSQTKIVVRRRAGVRTEAEVLRVVKEVADVGGLIVHTLVTHQLRQLMVRASRERNVEAIDLMGSLLARLSQRFAVSPSEKPGLFNQLNEAYFRRIETMEFALSHDDGSRIHEIHKAEIILLGVSRTFKTPLSVYLAFQGWFVANVPIVLGIEPPGAIFTLPTDRVFCLDTNPLLLSSLRRSRHEYLGGASGDYMNVDEIRNELFHARNVFRRQPKWQVITVANKPIEEIASEILSIRGPGSGHGAESK